MLRPSPSALPQHADSKRRALPSHSFVAAPTKSARQTEHCEIAGPRPGKRREDRFDFVQWRRLMARSNHHALVVRNASLVILGLLSQKCKGTGWFRCAFPSMNSALRPGREPARSCQARRALMAGQRAPLVSTGSAKRWGGREPAKRAKDQSPWRKPWEARA